MFCQVAAINDELLTQGVKMKGRKFCGLLVKQEHAEQFLLDEASRKLYEIRKSPVHFLKEGDRICLISMGRGGQHDRKALAILEFVRNVRLLNNTFNKHYAMHRVSPETFEALSKGWKQSHCFAWHFNLVKAFDCPATIPYVCGTQVWHYFTLADKDAPQARPNPTFDMT